MQLLHQATDTEEPSAYLHDSLYQTYEEEVRESQPPDGLNKPINIHADNPAQNSATNSKGLPQNYQKTSPSLYFFIAALALFSLSIAAVFWVLLH